MQFYFCKEISPGRILIHPKKDIQQNQISQPATLQTSFLSFFTGRKFKNLSPTLCYVTLIIQKFFCQFFQFPGTANPSHHFGGYGSLGIPPSMMTSSVTDQFQVAKPRMRICFDPETEIPKLQKWFAENNHPTRQQVLFFCNHIAKVKVPAWKMLLSIWYLLFFTQSSKKYMISII